jgi:hypothetical protein
MPIPFIISVAGIQQLRIEVIFPGGTRSGATGLSLANSARYAIVAYLQ